MSEFNKVSALRMQLKEGLGDKADKYFENMKKWFRMKITKEDFDYESRKILPRECSHLHNRFVLAILQRCQTLADSLNTQSQMPTAPMVMTMTPHSAQIAREHKRSEERSSRKKARGRDRGAFEAVDIADYIQPGPQAPPSSHNHASPLPSSLAPIAYEAFLPDSGLLLGRFLLAGWDHGVEGAEDTAAQLLSIALQHFLKGVLMAIFQQRSGFRLRDNQFIYGMGNPVPNPWLKNTAHLDRKLQQCRVEAYEEKRSRPSPEDAEQRAAYEIACATSQRGHTSTSKPPVSLFDVYDALKIHRSAIKSHLVYTMTMERITSRLSHPGQEELAAANIAP